MTAVPINRLALPKGFIPRCEITGLPATLQCSECPTYYATAEHFDLDWRGIRSLIAQDMVVLRGEAKVIGSEEERSRREEELRAIRRELLDLCTETAQKFLVQGKFELAVPGALQSLKFAIELFGNEAPQLVPAYLMLAEANLGLRKLKIAEEFLSLANWVLLKHKGEKEGGSSLMSNLQRNFGRLYAAQQRYNEALQAFATDVYYSSLEFGPENIRSAPSYFHMGRVFQSHQKSDRTTAFYKKVVSIYATFFEMCVRESKIGESGEISAVEVEEAIEIIKHITEYRDKRLQDEIALSGAGPPQAHVLVAEGRYALGLVFICTGENSVGADCLKAALEAMQQHLGEASEQTKACKEFLDIAEEASGKEAQEEDAEA
jgi:tetratricopeptide (TPR) repeat protein